MRQYPRAIIFTKVPLTGMFKDEAMEIGNWTYLDLIGHFWELLELRAKLTQARPGPLE